MLQILDCSFTVTGGVSYLVGRIADFHMILWARIVEYLPFIKLVCMSFIDQNILDRFLNK